MNEKLLLRRLLSSGMVREEEITGCSIAELNAIRTVAGRPLPDSYAAFISHFGRGVGRFLSDVDMFFPGVLSLDEDATDIFDDHDDLRNAVGHEIFVFAVRRKEQLLFFGDSSNDPKVLFYMWDDAAPTTVADSFWDFIETELSLAEENYSEVRGTPYDLYRPTLR